MEGGQGAMDKKVLQGAAEEATIKTLPGNSGGCDVCGKVAAEGELQKCGQCGWRCYCGTECQRKDWKQMRHKGVCNAIVGVRRRQVDLVELIMQNRVEEVRGLVLSGTVGVNDTLKPDPYGPLLCACLHGQLEMTTMLVEVGADVELRTSDETGHTVLIVAAQCGHDQIVQMLLERGGADPNVGSANEGATPLFMAAHNGHLDVVKVLVEVGRADVDLARTSCGDTPLIMAAQMGHLDIVRYLVQTGGADANKPAHNGCTPLYLAALGGHLDTVKVLVEVARADVDLATTIDGGTPLIMSAQNGHLEIVRYLVQTGGADANKPTHKGSTSLYLAALGGHLDIVKVLVRIGKADVNSKTKEGTTPLHAATGLGHTHVVKFLIRNGAQDTEFTHQHTGQIVNVDDLVDHVGDHTLTDYVASKRCAVCNKLCKPKLCKKCMKVSYCSSACQKSDWQKHKKVCKIVIKVGDTVQAKGLVGAAHLHGRSGRVIQNPDESSSLLAVLFEGIHPMPSC